MLLKRPFRTGNLMKQIVQNILNRFILTTPAQKKQFYCLLQKSIGTRYKPTLSLYEALSSVGSMILLPPLTKFHSSVSALNYDFRHYES